MVEETRPPGPPPEPAEIRYPDGRIEHPSVRHERSDANFRWILGILVGAMALAALIQYAVLRFFYGYRDYQAAVKTSRYPLAPGPAEPNRVKYLPAEPRLEQLDRISGVESSNVYERQLAKERALDSYGPTAAKDYVHIPIEQAMKLLADKLPARKASATDPWKGNGLLDAGASNSGRKFQQEP